MAWYGYGDGDFRPYVSVAERRARAARALAKLVKSNGRKPEPVVAPRRRQIASTFWGKAWCDNLERYADFANRLPRGRTYVRNGSVVDLAIGTGRVEARVAGSELYEVTIRMSPMAKARWHRVVARCTGRIGSLVGLLRGELSADVLAVLADAKEGLFPEPREMALACSCPDWADVCKHVAAVLYGVGIRLDEKPALFFPLRQVDETELLGSATSGAVSRTRSATGKRIAADKLADVFGIEIADEPAPARGRGASPSITTTPGRPRNGRPRRRGARAPRVAAGRTPRRRTGRR